MEERCTDRGGEGSRLEGMRQAAGNLAPANSNSQLSQAIQLAPNLPFLYALGHVDLEILNLTNVKHSFYSLWYVTDGIHFK